MAVPSEPIAGDGVAHRQCEKAETDGQHDEVHHGMLLASDTCGAECRWRVPVDGTRRRGKTAVSGFCCEITATRGVCFRDGAGCVFIGIPYRATPNGRPGHGVWRL